MDLHPDAAFRSTPVGRPCTAVLIDEDGHEYPLACELSFDPADPYAVSFTLGNLRHDVTWVFARTLLAEGVFDPVGEADVHVWPTVSAQGRARVAVELTNQGQTALVLVPTRATLAFLQETEDLVAGGVEATMVTLDAELDELLGGSDPE